MAAIKLVLSNMDEKLCNFHKLFKILYFSEKQHLSRYGRSITGDKYIAMKDGPVPSSIYDILKILRGTPSVIKTSIDWSHDFEVRENHYLKMINSEFDMDIFSESEIECLSQSIAENKNLSFTILRDHSHDSAWESANQNDEMSIFDIAKAGGANDEIIKYIAIVCENHSVTVN